MTYYFTIKASVSIEADDRYEAEQQIKKEIAYRLNGTVEEIEQ